MKNNKFQIRAYATAVHRRNMLHKKLYEARTPRIGIFFFANGELFADPVPIRYGYYVQGRPDFTVPMVSSMSRGNMIILRAPSLAH